jgi:thioredoxin 1
MHIINKEDLNDHIFNGDKVLVDFFASWCIPCKQLMPILESIETEFPNVKFVKFDVESDMEYISKYNIVSVPTVMILDGDKIVDISKGVKPAEYYKKILLNL